MVDGKYLDVKLSALSLMSNYLDVKVTGLRGGRDLCTLSVSRPSAATGSLA